MSRGVGGWCDAAGVVLTTGQRVRYVGLSGQVDGLTGRVSRVCKGYIKVKLDNGLVENYHPHDVRVVSR